MITAWFQDMMHGVKLKTIYVVGQPIGEDLAACAVELCEYFIPFYGSTECIMANALVTQTPSDFHQYSCGKTMPGVEVKVVGENGVTAGINILGEIYVRHPNMFKGYYNDLEKTAAVMTDDGWLKMDDIGRMDEDGVLYVEGRKSNMILSGGMNVSPTILEASMKTCAGIENVVVVPVSDPVRYRAICACVIIKTGYDVTEEQIRNFCRTIHNDKPGLFTVLPEFYMMMDKFPETNSGKTSRKELTLMAEKMFACKK